MIHEVWKKFDQADLTHSSVHHLLAIRTLSNEHGYARSIDVSNYLELSRSSVSLTLKKLKDKGYVEEDHNKFLLLSDKGKMLVNAILSKRRLVQKFFTDILKIDPTTAEEDACKVEHLLTQETSAKALSFLGFYLSDNKSAKAFRDEFDRFHYECSNHKAGCSICEVECFYSGKEELFA